MTDEGQNSGIADDYAALKSRADALEQQLKEVELQATARLRQSELKSEAVRAGIIDLDGLRLLDPAVMVSRSSESFDPAAIVSGLRREKPWLFGVPSSSSFKAAPAAVPARHRLATEMSVEEWRAARAELIRYR